MRISEDERMAINVVCDAGERHGYGNMIAHLQAAWAESLVSDHGYNETGAKAATLTRGPYPRQMHHDLRDHGHWDETGVRYRESIDSSEAGKNDPRNLEQVCREIKAWMNAEIARSPRHDSRGRELGELYHRLDEMLDSDQPANKSEG